MQQTTIAFTIFVSVRTFKSFMVQTFDCECTFFQVIVFQLHSIIIVKKYRIIKNL